MSNDRTTALARLFKWIAVCVLLAAVLILFAQSGPFASRAVIVSSDDSGMCASANQGAIQALRAGIVKSTSIMTCCPAFEEFAEFARANPQYDYAVHLTLTCDLRERGWGPVLPKDQVPTLVDAEGFLHSSTYDVARNADLGEVEAELKAQIRKAQDAGIKITHLDHHMWVLFGRDDLLRLYVKLGQEFNLPVRYSREIPRQVSGDQAIATYLEQMKVVEQSGFPVVDWLEAANYSVPPGEKRAYFLNQLRNLRPGVTEIVIHCASPGDSLIPPPDAAARYADTTTFSSEETREELTNQRVEVLDWQTLRTWRR